MQLVANFIFLKLSLGPCLSIFLVAAELVWKTQVTDGCEVTS